MVSNLYPPHYLGGYELLCRQVACELSGRGHELLVLTSDHGAAEVSGVLDGLPVRWELHLETPFDRAPRVSRLLRVRTGAHNAGVFRKTAASFKPDLVFIWSQLRLTIACARAAEAMGMPMAWTLNDPHPAGYLPAPFRATPKGVVRWATDRTVFRSATLLGLSLSHLTCISRTLRDDLNALGFSADGAQVIYQGIPVGHFPMKSAAGGLGTPPRVLYAGQLHAYKGVHTLIEAARLIQERGLAAPRITIAGTGPEEYVQSLILQSEKAGVDARFPGRVPHEKLPGLYRENDIFAFTSTWREPFGLTHLEAMASGTPVVSTHEGGHGEFLRHGENALLFEKEDARGLADRLAELLNDAELRLRLALAARREVEESFSMKRYVDDLETFLKTACVKVAP